jgi:hypothetical protein
VTYRYGRPWPTILNRPPLTEAEAVRQVAADAVAGTVCARHGAMKGQPCPGVTLGACAERRRLWDALASVRQ